MQMFLHHLANYYGPSIRVWTQANAMPRFRRGQEYAGELSETPKDAEKSAAQQALKAGPAAGSPRSRIGARIRVIFSQMDPSFDD